MGKSKTHKRSRKWLLGVVILLIAAGYVGWLVLQPFTSIQPVSLYKSPATKSQKVSLAWPSYGQAAIGAIGYGVLATSGDQKPLPTASIAKLLTALSVISQRPLRLGDSGPSITITQDDINSYNKYVALNGSVVGVGLGEKITEYQALQALLLPSANNMAETLARWAFGSIDAFNSYANAYAQELGLSSLTITDPSGFLPTTVASAHDLTILGEQVMLQPVIAQIVAQPSAVIPVQGTIYNVNFLIGSKHNVGIKTGNNDQDPGAYLFAFDEPVGKSSVLIVGTIMGGPDLSIVLKDAVALAESAASHFKQVSYAAKGQVVASYTPKHGKTAQAVAVEDLSILTWDGISYSSRVSLQTLHGTTPAGSVVGKLTVTDNKTHATNSVDVVLKQPLKLSTLTIRLAHPL